MDRVWMRRQLEQYVALLEGNPKVFDDLAGCNSAGFQPTAQSAAVVAAVRRIEPTITQIMGKLSPDKFGSLPYRLPLFYRKRLEEALVALAQLDHGQEWAQRLSPEAPPLPIERFHPWVWQAASPLWTSGHRRQAVLTAASAISAETRAKAGCAGTSDTQVMKQAFTPQPAGQRYLRVRPHGGNGADAAQDAVRTFAVGCFTAIRNPAAHAAGPDWDEQLALEYLATLSILARWVSEADVVTA